MVKTPGRKSGFRSFQRTTVPGHGDLPLTSQPAPGCPLKEPRPTLMSAQSLADARAVALGFLIPPETVLRSQPAAGQNQIMDARPKPSLIPEAGMLAGGASSVYFL